MGKEFNEKEQEIIQACQSNHWLSDWEEYPAYDYDYGFREVSTPEELKEIFEDGNWSIRSAVIFGDLAFVQQVNGGDEWLTMKHEEGRYKVFESVSFQVVVANRGEQGFYEYLNKLQTQTVDQYWGREPVVQENLREKYPECLEVCEKIYDNHYYREYDLTPEDFTLEVVESREALQDFFKTSEAKLGSMALYGELFFLKEEADQDKWLIVKKEDGQYSTADVLPMREVANNPEDFEAVINCLERYSTEQYLEEFGAEPERDSTTISVLKVEVGKEPYVKEVSNDLKSLQAEVGGLIQVVYLEDSLEGAMMVVNEEGKINGLEMNRRLPGDIVCGDFFICMGDEEGDFTSLTPEKIQKYTEMFQEIPEFSDHEPDAEPRITFHSFD